MKEIYQLTISSAASIPIAIARSKELPSFLISAGARFIVNFLSGNFIS